jgi:hypothetical protein
MSTPSNPPGPKQAGITFPPFPPKLKLERRPTDKSPGHVEDERNRLEGEKHALEDREPDLKKHEERSRAVEQEGPAREETVASSAVSTSAPFGQHHRSGSVERDDNDGALQTGWEQLHRARELLEAEQGNVRNERVGLRDFNELLKLREAAVAAREVAVADRERAVAEREAQLAAAAPPPDPAAASTEASAMTRLTRAPFAIARSVLGPKK